MNIDEFAKKVEIDQVENYHKRYGYDSPDLCASATRVSIEPGRKYTKIDVGTSGKFLVDQSGNIYGIKAYGVINLKKYYGTLETMDQYFWGEYAPVKKLGDH